MCFNKLLTFILAIFRLFNLATQCIAESNSPIVGPRHALPELSFATSNGEVSCIVELSLVGLLAGLVVVPTTGVDKWIYEHASDCLVWTANEITANIDHGPRQERWYEITDGEASVIDDNNIPRSLFDSTVVKNISYQDLREMAVEPNVSRSNPADSCAVHRSFVRDGEQERIAVPRYLRRSFQLPSSSSALSDEENNHCPLELCKPPTHDEAEPSQKYQKTQGEEEEEEEQVSSPEDVFQIISTQTGWVMNDDKYMYKVYEHIRWRCPAEQLPQRPILAFCTRRDAAKREEKDVFTKPDPYIDA
ncbi:Hypothetical predicted protein [Paramuricea clavata]|uniref:Uncharacterized protein n=1 Tax=Paramuricea clavata TaxID=317549 RepID=A0A6S7HN32_PARCT|nr:Hypothetical predicted protein [Paramuricea clavata]